MIAWLAGAAHASSVGVGLGGAIDLPDAQYDGTAFGPSPNLLVPVRIDLTEFARIRATVHVAFGWGHDTVSWMSGDRRVSEESPSAFFGSTALLAGGEVRLPVDGLIRPYFGGSVGAALVHTWHSLGRAELFGPEYTDDQLLHHPNATLDPYSRQLVWASDLALGAELGAVWAEAGYALQFVPDAELRKANPQLGVRHEPYGWNALRVVVGIAIPVGGKD